MNSIFDVFGYIFQKIYLFVTTVSIGGAVMFYVLGSILFITFFRDLFVGRVKGGGN